MDFNLNTTGIFKVHPYLPKPYDLRLGHGEWAQILARRILNSEGNFDVQQWTTVFLDMAGAMHNFEAVQPDNRNLESYVEELEQELWLRIWEKQPNLDGGMRTRGFYRNWDDVRERMETLRLAFPEKRDEDLISAIRQNTSADGWSSDLDLLLEDLILKP